MTTPTPLRVISAVALGVMLIAAVSVSAPRERAPAQAPGDASLPPGALSIDPPAPPGSTSPALAAEGATTVTNDHEVLMTWLEPGEPGGRLVFARLSGQAWTQPVTVAAGVKLLGPADRPSLTVIDTQGVRRTLIARTGDVVARSGDAGRTWARLPSPALPFASFTGGDEGGYAFWLAVGGHGPPRLVGTRILAGEEVLDASVPAEAPTTAVMTWDGPLVVYWDRDAAGSSQIAIVRRENARWTEPRPLHAEGWRADRGARSGLRVAARQRQVAVAWHDEGSGHVRVLVAFSGDAGRTFDPPVEVDASEEGQAPSGPVDVTLDGDGQALVLWMKATGPSEAVLSLARVAPDGRRGEELALARGRLGGPPQIVRAGGRVAVAWTEGTLRQVRAVALPLADVPPALEHRARAVARPTPRPPSSPGRGEVGDAAPELELPSLGGDDASLAALRGRAVLLNLWATWCGPCVLEMPELAVLHERYRAKGLVVVGVNVDSADDLEKVRAFVAERKVPFGVWLDPANRAPRALRVRGLPATFVIDREGRITWRRDRAITARDPGLLKALEAALGK